MTMHPPHSEAAEFQEPITITRSSQANKMAIFITCDFRPIINL